MQKYVAFPLQDEKNLTKGVVLNFNASWKLESTEDFPLPRPDMPTVRPTVVPLNEGKQLLLVGGCDDRTSQLYDFV